MTIENKLLSLDDFKQVVSNAPLFAIDLVVVNHSNEILVGQRLNAPAKGYWFVPGGRVYKGETLDQAFKRICKCELGCELDYQLAWLIGLYDHLYDDSVFRNDIPTHYVSAAYCIKLNIDNIDILPKHQHEGYRWKNINEIEDDGSVHEYSKLFLNALKERLA